MDKEPIKLSHPAKISAGFVQHHLSRSGYSGPPFINEGQYQGMTLNRFPENHLSNYSFSAFEHQSKLKLNLHVHVPLKSIQQSYEDIHALGILCISEDVLTV